MTDASRDRMTVWKYTLPAKEEFTIEMPRQARLLRVDFQDHNLCMWAMVDPEMSYMSRHFAIRGTGQEAAGLWWETYIGTAIHPTAPLVLHIWERAGV